MNFEELSACLKCGQEPALIQHFGQWTVQCPCGVKQGYRFFNQRIAISEWNQNSFKYVAEKALRQDGRRQVMEEKLSARKLGQLKKLPEEAFLSLEEAILLTGHSATLLYEGRKSGALVFEGDKYRKKELLAADYDSLSCCPKVKTRAQRVYTAEPGTPERDAQENAYRKEMFALPDDTLFSTEQTEFFTCTSRGRIERHLKDGKIKQTNGFFKKSDVIQWRKAYPPENNGVSESSRRKLALKLAFMLGGKEVVSWHG